MEKSVLIEVVRSLDKKEVRELNKWLQSPAHNQREDTLRLFVFLVKALAKSENPPEKEAAWKAVFPGQSYDDAYMRQVMFFLLKAIEEYLVFKESVSDSVRFQVALTKIYRQRKIEKSYKQSSKTAKDGLQSQPLRDSFYLQNQFFIEQEEYVHQVITTKSVPHIVNLQEIADSLEKWFITEKLQNANSMLAHQRLYQKAQYDYGLLEEVLAYVGKGKWLEEPSIGIYYYVYMAYKEPEEEKYFEQLEHLIPKYENAFTQSELRNIYVAAINYCVPKINKGRLDFARRAFELYRKGFEKNTLLLDDNTLNRYTFGNAVAFALKSGEFDWAESFIKNFSSFIDEKERNSIKNFNLSRLYFEKGDYKKAQTLLTQFEYGEMHLNIIAKTMLLKIYYETDEYDALESLIDSMRIYLQRKESLDANRKASYKNLLSVTKKLLQVNILSRSEREKFREVVVSTNPLAERDWLLKQLEGRK